MKVASRTRSVSMPSERASVSFMITARAERPSRVPSIVSANTSADRERGEKHEQAVDGIVDGQHPDRSGHQVWNELHVTAERQRDELADDDAEPPGCKDRVERAPIEGPDDEQFSDAAREWRRLRRRWAGLPTDSAQA